MHIKGLPDAQLLTIIQEDLCPSFITDFPQWHEDTLLALIGLYKPRIKTLVELIEEIKAVYCKPAVFEDAEITAWVTPSTSGQLGQAIILLQSIAPFSADAIASALKDLSKKLEIKIVALAQPLRISLIGKSSGPGVFELMAILGKQETIERIQVFISFIEKKK